MCSCGAPVTLVDLVLGMEGGVWNLDTIQVYLKQKNSPGVVKENCGNML